jgi:outer membrane protein OmpA-like peptidoglycan-associated protein
MNLKTKCLIAGLSVAGMLSGCASVMPAQLIEARGAYDTSSTGLAAKLAPTELYDARKSLDKANREFEENGDTVVLRDFSYIALRKVELADVKARTEQDRMWIADAVKQGVVMRDTQVKSAKVALADSRAQLKEERNANEVVTTELKAANTAQGKELQKTGAQLETERLARMSAESKLAGAMKDLATIAAIKEDARGVVITLSGSVLFASGKFALLETAKAKLDQVAEALKDQSDDKKMVVEGHTDSQGTDAINQPLSLSRASAVLDYLVNRGVDATKISAIGMGSTRPILDNRNAENRANNRRVEIIIQPSRLTER